MNSWQKALVEAELAAVDSLEVSERDLVIKALRRQAERARKTMNWYALLYWDLDEYAARCTALADDLGMEAVEEQMNSSSEPRHSVSFTPAEIARNGQ